MYYDNCFAWILIFKGVNKYLNIFFRYSLNFGGVQLHVQIRTDPSTELRMKTYSKNTWKNHYSLK